MSVLVKGMKMPETCSDCDLCYDMYLCKATGVSFYRNEDLKDFEMYDMRLPDCPLVKVPANHGRLIDADALMERFEEEERAADEHGRDFSFSFKSGGENCAEWWAVQRILEEAPTVIEAEEGE